MAAPRVPRLALSMIAALLSPAVQAAPIDLETWVPRPVLGRPVFDLRAGVDGVAQDGAGMHPYLCGEVSPIWRLSVEACGNGAGVLHQADVPDMAHFRVRLAALTRRRGRAEGTLLGGVGLTEVQRTSDAPGFRLGAAETGQVEAAGPEISLGIKGRYWLEERAYLVVGATVGAAHIPGASEVMGWRGPTVGFGSLTVGAGF